MANLGVVYTKTEIEGALNTPPPGAGFDLVGLTFSRLPADFTPAVDAGDLGGFLDQLLVSRQLAIDAIFYKTGGVFDSRVVNLPLSSTRYIVQNLTENIFEDPAAARPTPGGRIHRANQARLATSDYQFWHIIEGFVYFGKAQLETLVLTSDEITISGAEINYGTAVFDHAEGPGNVSYPTLKAENSQQNALGELVPDVAIALPCPPIWGGGGAWFNSGIGEEFSEFNSNWRQFAKKHLKEIKKRQQPGGNRIKPFPGSKKTK